MKKLIAITSILMTALLYSMNAIPCSPAPASIIWPDNEQTDVPTNARLVFNCGYSNNCLDNDKTPFVLTRSGSTTPVALGQPVKIGRYYIFTPLAPLAQNTEYEIKSEWVELDTKTFTTGSDEDTTPPDLSGAKANVDFEWFDNAEQVIVPGPCFGDGHALRSDLDEYNEDQVKGDVPEHYEISVNIQNAANASDFVMFKIYQIDENGVETEYAKSAYGYYSDGDFGAEMNGKKMALRFEAIDAMGNVQSQSILIEFDFNRKDSKATSSFDIITPPPPPPEAEDSSGCSINTCSHASIGSIIYMLAALGLAVGIFGEMRRKANS